MWHTRQLQLEHSLTTVARNFASTSGTTLNKTGATSSRQTIFALATGTGRAGVAIIRISGPSTRHILSSLCPHPSASRFRLPPSHKLVLRDLYHPITGELLDAGAGLIYFPTGKSYTGEESLELHVHGGSATVRDVLDAVGQLNNTEQNDGVSRGKVKVRPAEAGEFTRRAFENGRLDLASAEALHSLVLAETTMQRKVALQGTSGLQTTRFEAIRSELLQAMAMVEALIDFGDEDGVEQGTWAAAVESVESLSALLRSELGVNDIQHDAQDGKGKGKRKGKVGRHAGEILTTGIRLAIYGPPNAGKSSLLNRLADRNAAIVSDIPGTTRDVLQVHLDLDGYKVIVYDTAGIRDEANQRLDEIERIGIERAREVVAAADLSLLVLPADTTLSDVGTGKLDDLLLRPDTYTHLDPDLIFYNKLDLLPSPSSAPDHEPLESSSTTKIWRGSILNDVGITSLIAGLAELVSQKYALGTIEAPLITQSRHRFHLTECLHHITAFLDLARDHDAAGPDLVLAAEELRYAAKAVGRVTGKDVSPDEILGSIFSTFCIGK